MGYIEWLPILIVLILSVGGFSTLIIALFLNYRRRQLISLEILAAIEKGIDVPIIQEVKKPGNLKHRGIIWTAVGAATFFFFFLISGDIGPAAMGLIPFAIGLAYLFIARDEEKNAAQ